MPRTFRPPRTQRLYDVCVVGSQLGGIAAGALLARRGYRVLHVDHDGLGGSYEDGGWLLPYAPAVVPSLKAFPAASSVLAEVGLSADLDRHLEPCRPDLQLILPRHRFDLHRETAARLAELEREWPGSGERLEASFAEADRLLDASTPFLAGTPPLPPTSLRQRWALSRALRSSPALPGAPFAGLDGHPLSEALEAFARFLHYLEGDAPPLGLTRLLGAAARGTWRLPGGYEGLREILRRRIAESRGELLGGDGAPAIAESLEVEHGRVASVRVVDLDDIFAAKAFVSATDSPALRRLIPGGGERLAALLDKVRPARQLLTVNLVVKAADLPPPLGETVLCLGVADPEIGPALLVQVLAARRSGRTGPAAPAGDERVVCAAGFVSARSRDRGADHLADLAARLKAALDEALPFVGARSIHESVPLLAASPERRGSRLMSHPLYDVQLPRTLGVTGLPGRSPIKNLFFAGREVLPGLGIEGEFHAALQAAAGIQDLLGKKERLR